MKRAFGIGLIVTGLVAASCGKDPEPPTTNIITPTLLDDGEACRASSVCAGGTCYADLLGYPDGYCTTRSCSSDDDCNGTAACLGFVDGSSACFARCTEECRSGYSCAQAGDESVCAPTDLDLESIVLTSDVSFEQTLNALGADCTPEEVGNGRFTFEFVLSESANGFMFVPFVGSGEVAFERLSMLGAGVTRQEYRHHNTRIEDVGTPGREPFGTFGTISFDWPVLVPFAPSFQDLVVPGETYIVEVSATQDTPCLYVVESFEESSQVDLDIYLVTRNGATAAEAAESPDFAAALAAAEGHLASAGVTFGQVRYHDAAPEVSERFSIVRDLREIDLLAATGAPVGPSLDEHLSVDVFIVDSIVFDGITALGISAGVPGPAGMHGNLSNGLVFSAPDLGLDNELVGQTLAHELSHYLGLRHTTELIHGSGTDTEAEIDAAFGTTDPIADTPECVSVPRLGRSCPDYQNLMFPTIQTVPEGTVIGLTQGQASTLRRSPLVK